LLVVCFQIGSCAFAWDILLLKSSFLPLSSQNYRPEPLHPAPFFSFFFAVLGFEFWAYTLSHSTSPFL
jgi:hypothetical protein